MTGRTRHVPLRRCVSCRASLPKAELVRLVRDEAGWRHDAMLRAGGRGTWVCLACLGRLDERDTTRALARAFRQDAPQVGALLRALRDARGGAAPSATATSNDSRHGGTHG
jgi:uncharacterized protein